jgi:hypothetical protein
MELYALLRPDSWNLPLLVHVLGAMTLVGALVVAAVAFVAAAGGSGPMTRLGFKAMLYGVIPGWIVMRAGAAWIADKEFGSKDPKLTWLDIGFITAEPGLLLIIIGTVVAWRASKRVRSGEQPSALMRRVPMGLTVFLIAAYVVTVYAMTAKPS